MDRRGVLRSMLSAVTGSHLFVANGGLTSTKENRPDGRGPRSIQFIETSDHVRLFHRDWGTGNPVVFLAPWGLHSDWWEYQMAHLVRHGIRCIGYDRRGHGRSAEPVGGYDFHTLADDLDAVIETLDLRNVSLIAQSIGCGEVARYLARHGAHRIARIAMIAPITPLIVRTASNPDGVDSDYLAKVREVLSTDRPNAITNSARAFFGTPPNTVSVEMMQWWTEMLLQCPLKVLIELHREFTVCDFTGDLRAIELPTLIIHGDKDTSTPIDLTARKTAGLIRGSELKVYEGAAHGLPITHMKRLNSDLLAFVKG